MLGKRLLIHSAWQTTYRNLRGDTYEYHIPFDETVDMVAAGVANKSVTSSLSHLRSHSVSGSTVDLGVFVGWFSVTSMVDGHSVLVPLLMFLGLVW